MSIWSILVVILMLGLLVTIHELGHFWVARAFKIKVYEVSIFIGPVLFKWEKNGVQYSIRCIPLGAYVRFSDVDENGNPVNEDDPDQLINQKRWKRLIVALAGPFMNAVLGVLIFIGLNIATGYTSLDIGPALEYTQLYGQDYEVGDTLLSINGDPVFTYFDAYYELEEGQSKLDNLVLKFRSKETGEKYEVTLVPEVSTRPMLGISHYDTTDNKYNGWEIVTVDDSQNNGDPILEVGDYLIAVDGIKVTDEAFTEKFSELDAGDTMLLTYVRNGVTYEEECVKTMITYANDNGVRLISYNVDTFDEVMGAIKSAALMPVTICNISIRAIGDVFEGQEEVYNMVSGPVGVTSAVSDVVDDVDTNYAEKIVSVVTLVGIISIGLMFTNLLPIPGLDGVQIILLIVEMIIGRPLSKKAETVINVIGIIMLFALVIFALASDIIRLLV